jgi:maltooligosyltrehalose trehalohydrolase
LAEFLTFDELKLAAGVMLLSPYLPLLFMGEEYAEPAQFMYFTDFKNEVVNKGVKEGRKNEVTSDMGGDPPPNPTDQATFLKSKLNYDLMTQGRHCVLWLFYQELIRLRKSIPALADLNKQNMQVTIDGQGGVMTVHRWNGDSKILAVFNFQDNLAEVVLPPGRWQLHLNSGSESWTPEQADPLAAAKRERRVITEQIRLGPKTFYLLEHAD